MDASAVVLANGHLRIKRTRYGLIAYNINDMYVGRSLDCYGEYVPDQMALLAQLAAPASVVLDVGANIGAITLFLSQLVGPRGIVVAIEPQRAIYQVLCANLALNGIGNVRAIHAGAGRASGRAYVPAINYDSPDNFGGVELSQNSGEPVDVITIDNLRLPACQLIKIDVEGQEQAVIAGAAETIARFKPAIYVENDRRNHSADLIRQIQMLGYVLYWHLTPFYRADNFYGNSTNVWPGLVSVDMLCLPSSDTRKIEGMRPVSSPNDWPFPD